MECILVSAGREEVRTVMEQRIAVIGRDLLAVVAW